jgi:hypothetical protein
MSFSDKFQGMDAYGIWRQFATRQSTQLINIAVTATITVVHEEHINNI